MHKLLCIVLIGIWLVASHATAISLESTPSFESNVLELLKGAQQGTVGQNKETSGPNNTPAQAANQVSLLATGASVDLASTLQR